MEENVVSEEVVETPNEKATRELGEAIHEFGEGLEKRQELIDDMNVTLDKVDKDQAQLAADMEKREQELFQKEVAFSLKENGLEVFADIIHVKDSEQLSDIVQKLTGIVNGIKLESGYIPKENAKQAEYDVFTEKKDVKNMIGSKLANLFK